MEYKNENRICQNCKNDFTIESDDFLFYEKIQVPPPTWCPECRYVRRLSWRNERTFYKRKCDKTGANIVGMYKEGARFPVYASSVWWGDSWDAKDFGQDFDFSKTFFEQFKELQNKVPRSAMLNTACVDCEFSNHSANSKNCYMCTGAFGSENCLHSAHILPAKNSSDVYRAEGSSNENLFECINVHDCYNCQYCYLVTNSFDCYYSFDLKNCSNCFLSYNLRGQSYVFRNQKYSKEEYFQKIKEFNLKSHTEREKLYNEWLNIVFNEAIHKNLIMESALQSLGNFLYHSNNAMYCFDTEKVENSKYLSLSANITDSYDLYGGGLGSSLLYECHAVAMNSSNVMFSHLSRQNRDIAYCDGCQNSQNLFGCVGVKNGNYLILNKQYSKDEYLELKEKIIAHMKATGEWGQFFPAELSPFGYNESTVFETRSKEKDEVLKMGYSWEENLPGTYNKSLFDMNNLKDNIDEVDEGIMREILTCQNSARNYNLIRQEYDFFKNNNIPIPRLHPLERYKLRLSIRGNTIFYDTVCGKCGESIKTCYSEDLRPKNILCESCYKKQVY